MQLYITSSLNYNCMLFFPNVITIKSRIACALFRTILLLIGHLELINLENVEIKYYPLRKNFRFHAAIMRITCLSIAYSMRLYINSCMNDIKESFESEQLLCVSRSFADQVCNELLNDLLCGDFRSTVLNPRLQKLSVL